MSVWYGKIILLLGLIVTILIRIPHDKVSKKTEVSDDRQDGLERLLLSLMGIGTLVMPLLFIATPILDFANYQFSAIAFILGINFLALNFWMFHRSHADLGANWSVSLQIRNGHRLVDSGIYAKIRHPMYTSIFFVRDCSGVSFV